MAEERRRWWLVRLMNEIMERWPEMEGKDKVVCVVDKACKNGRVRREVERLYRKCSDWMMYKQDPNDFCCFDYGVLWDEHPGVYIIVYEHDVHLKIMNYELWIIQYVYRIYMVRDTNNNYIFPQPCCVYRFPRVTVRQYLGARTAIWGSFAELCNAENVRTCMRNRLHSIKDCWKSIFAVSLVWGLSWATHLVTHSRLRNMLPHLRCQFIV